MINPSIQRLLLGKREQEAIDILRKFKCSYRIMMRDGSNVGVAHDRNDDRYNLVIKDGLVERILAG
jgi:hypothetical protein